MPGKWDAQSPKPDFASFVPTWSQPTGLGWWSPREDQGLEGYFRQFLNWLGDGGGVPTRNTVVRLARETKFDEVSEDWKLFVSKATKAFTDVVSDWRSEYDLLLDAWKNISGDQGPDRGYANALRYQLMTLAHTTVIETLADRQFLPRYGFPIGVLRLKVIVPDERTKRIREEDQFRLERPGLLALREYVPGSELLVGGRVVRSRGLMKHWTGQQVDEAFGLSGSYATCTKGHFYYAIAGTCDRCPTCDAGPKSTPATMLLPRHGFTSAAWETPRRSTTSKSVGQVERATMTFGHTKTFSSQDQSDNGHEKLAKDYAGIRDLEARYRESGELLVYHRGENRLGFVVCSKCGYADSEPELKNGKGFSRGREGLGQDFLNHPPLRSATPNFPCWKRSEAVNPLRYRTLAAKQTTDVLLLDFSGCLSPGDPNHESIVTTLALALQIAGARMLELDSREIGSMAIRTGGDGFGAVLYDNVPGGAGHVRELLDRGRDWLAEATRTLYVDEPHDKTCEIACLDCLLTFDAQVLVQSDKLQRRKALDALKSIMGT